jgi:homoserine O-acetyltransferase/O-succinyltransferase
MTTPAFESSDAIRSGKLLQHVQTVRFAGPITLEKGDSLPHVTVAYETYGTLSPNRDNAILICHALSGDSHVARHDPKDDPGWWDLLVGPGKPIDTDRFFVICPNVLGGCRGTSGPSDLNPKTGKPFGGDFPLITVADMVDVQRRLVDHLGIAKLLAVVGGSMGGHMVLTWAIRYPSRVAGAVALATSPRLTTQALAFDVVGRNAISRDPHFHDGEYYDQPAGPDVGLAVARMLAHITYLSPASMDAKFEPNRHQPRDIQTQFENKFSVGSYLAYQGHRFVERFDANSYITLSMAMDLFDIGGTPAALRASLAQSACRWLVVSFSTDWLFPPFQSRQIADALLAENKPVTAATIESSCGHDAFLLEADIDRYGELIRAFLLNLLPGAAALRPDPSLDTRIHGAAGANNIFHGQRLDYDQIEQLIPPGASVLDLGCGSARLLSRLAKRGPARLLGIELDEHAVVACARRGIDVLRADLNEGLANFADAQFDVVVLSQTLQSVRDVKRVLADMLRVGKTCIVSFPNFAYAPLRRELYEQGRAPRGAGASTLLGHAWFESPNIRFLSITDFDEYCATHRITVQKLIALDTARGTPIPRTADPNLNADLAIFVISR